MDRFFNRFFFKEDIMKNDFFIKLVDDISYFIGKSADKAAGMAKQAIISWEKATNMDFSVIYNLNPEEKAKEVGKILEDIVKKANRILQPGKIFEEFFHKAAEGLGALFNVDKKLIIRHARVLL